MSTPPKSKSAASPPEDVKGLTARQQLFVAAWNGPARGNGTKAAIAAGYSPHSAESQASRLLRNAKVRAACKEQFEETLRHFNITKERVLQELACFAFFDPAEALDPETGELLPLHKMPPHARRAIAQVDVEEVWESDGDGGRTQTGVLRKVRAHSKERGLELIGKNLKMFTDKVDLSGAKGLTLEQAIALARAKVAQKKGGGR